MIHPHVLVFLQHTPPILVFSSCPSPHAPLLMPLSSCPSPHAPLLMPLSSCPSPHAPLLMPLSSCPSPHAPLLMPLPSRPPHNHAPPADASHRVHAGKSPIIPSPHAAFIHASLTRLPLTPLTVFTPERSFVRNKSTILPRNWTITAEVISESPIIPSPHAAFIHASLTRLPLTPLTVFTPERSFVRNKSTILPRNWTITAEVISESPIIPSPHAAFIHASLTRLPLTPLTVFTPERSFVRNKSTILPRNWTITAEVISESPIIPSPHAAFIHASLTRLPLTPLTVFTPERSFVRNKSTILPRNWTITAEVISESPIIPSPHAAFIHASRTRLPLTPLTVFTPDRSFVPNESTIFPRNRNEIGSAAP
ncbi:unnamed protein product [Closterium sp. Naga37s-1]|nr:unnamed protein product [Closterium sp. Naga37s-1]